MSNPLSGVNLATTQASKGSESLETASKSDINEILDKDWEENSAYVESIDQEWYAGGDHLYLQEVYGEDKDHSQQLMYLEEGKNFGPEVVATGSEVDGIVEMLEQEAS